MFTSLITSLSIAIPSISLWAMCKTVAAGVSYTPLDFIPTNLFSTISKSPITLKFVVEAMRRTANGGTAKVVGRKDADMGGKTGTAQVVKLKMAAGDRRLKMSEMEYAQRDHAWIATWGVKDGKSYVVIVMVEHGGGGSSVAGPVARKVYEHLFGPDPNAPMLALPPPTPVDDHGD